jgi:hypothetical protein
MISARGMPHAKEEAEQQKRENVGGGLRINGNRY